MRENTIHLRWKNINTYKNISINIIYIQIVDDNMILQFVRS